MRTARLEAKLVEHRFPLFARLAVIAGELDILQTDRFDLGKSSGEVGGQGVTNSVKLDGKAHRLNYDCPGVGVAASSGVFAGATGAGVFTEAADDHSSVRIAFATASEVADPF